MQTRISKWAVAGFVIAVFWVLATSLMSPEQLFLAMRTPAFEVAAWMTLPVSFAFRHLPIPFWVVPLINAATYALAGLVMEILRPNAHAGEAI